LVRRLRIELSEPEGTGVTVRASSINVYRRIESIK